MLWEMSYFINEKTYEEYSKWVREVSLPYWRSAAGFKEMRAYIEPGTGRVKVLAEFDSFKAWGKVMDDPVYKENNKKFASYTHGLKWHLWDASENYPDPIKPSK